MTSHDQPRHQAASNVAPAVSHTQADPSLIDAARTRWTRRLILSLPWILILWGLELRLRHFFADRSLWLDELQIALNIIHRSFHGLLEPLANGQVAPVGWLFLEKLVISLLGHHEQALRLVPLLAGIATLPLIYRAARKYFDRRASLVSLLLMATSTAAIFYADETKQYATDALAATCMLLLAITTINDQHKTSRRWLALGVIGAALLLLSQPLVFILAGIGLSLLIQTAARRQWRAFRAALLVSTAWAATFLVIYALFLSHVSGPDWAWLYAFWTSRGAFPTLAPTHPADWLWWPRALVRAAQLLVHPTWAAIGILVVAALGAKNLWHNNRPLLGFLTLPIALALAAATVRRYPFSGRLILFLTPTLALLIGAGFNAMRHWPNRRNRQFALLVAAVFLAPCLVRGFQMTVVPNLGYQEETRPVIAWVGRHYRQGDSVVLTFWTHPAWRYYHTRFGMRNVQPAVAQRDSAAIPSFTRILRHLQGHERVWLIFSHFSDPNNQGPTQHLAIANHFGHMVKKMQTPGAAGYLYNLNQPAPGKSP